MGRISKQLQQRHILLLLIILGLSLFLRTYQIVDRLGFDHDGDLFSWIVKDIVIDKHLRLIGQLTSADGIFIGPLFYYMLIPFFLLFRMDPIGGVVPITAIGVLTTLSYYIVFSQLWNRKAGLIGAFFHAVLLSSVYFDQRVVPSTLTNLWTIWYFYTLINIARGNFRPLWLLGILTGLIWHIHIALFPALVAVPFALLVAKKRPDKKAVVLFVIILILTSLPLLAFEVRHDFSQTQSLIQNFKTPHNVESPGISKLNHVILKVTGNVVRLFFYPQNPPFNHKLLLVALLLSPVLLNTKKLLSFKEVSVFYVWIFGVMMFFSFSSSILSEYYFANIEVIFLASCSLTLLFLLNSSRVGKYLVLGLLGIILVKNMVFLVTYEIYQKGYSERKAIANYITSDSKTKGYPCVSVSYITPPGENVGFRYFFWLNKLHVNQPSSGAPVYTIVHPIELAPENITFRSGQIGVILPERMPPEESLKKSCSGENANLTDSMFGFTR
ncbi:MAG: hypothetical protein HYU80_03075 [Candidatus Blackburnbacteria bacterium]|nr:hypothetical protein [Candidatus Blackburnbacteria bacterium]